MREDDPRDPFDGPPRDVAELEEYLSRPTADVVRLFARLEGDLVVLGAGGKMGPTLCRMAWRAMQEAGAGRRQVWAVSRFRDGRVREQLEGWGIHTRGLDLLDVEAARELPVARLVVSMSGFKFGAGEAPEVSWATNCVLPVGVCARYADSRMVAFSTGNVYGMVPVHTGGSRPADAPRPDGEYARAAAGRERVYQYLSAAEGIELSLLRLNYATEMRYGVLVDLAEQVRNRQPVPLDMGYVNVLWQGDANAMSLRALDWGVVGGAVLNLAGEEILPVRRVAQQFADRFDCRVEFTGREQSDAYLNDGREDYRRLGRPRVSADRLIEWTADWIERGGLRWQKPTSFQTRSGQF